METNDPIIGQVRQLARLVISNLDSEKSIRKDIELNVINSFLIFSVVEENRENIYPYPKIPLILICRHDDIWSLKVKLGFRENLYRIPLTNMFGETKTVQLEIHRLPEYFEQYDIGFKEDRHPWRNRNFTHNSFEAATFYTLAYADVLDVRFSGSKTNMENDLTLAYVSYSEEMAKLR